MNYAPTDGSGPRQQLRLPKPGYGQHTIPEMPAYISGYSGKGNSFDALKTPVMVQSRVGNKRGRGGMEGYINHAEDDTFFEGYRQKKGNHGVFAATRWSPGHDWRGNFGVANLSELRNYAGLQTRGGQLRKGGPRRSDYIERPGHWQEQARPGIATGRYVQTNNNFSGIREDSRRTPFIQRDNDMLVLRQMIEHNPFHIGSHSAKQAKAAYDEEFSDAKTFDFKAYQDNFHADFAQMTIDQKDRTIREESPFMRELIHPNTYKPNALPYA
jgi:hypothetical protein